MTRQYRPGERRSQFKPERFIKQRKAWLQIGMGQIILYEYDPNDEDLDEMENGEVGNVIRLIISRVGGRPLKLNLSSLTEAELDEMVNFFQLVESRVRPVIQMRDKVAQDAFEEGDDAFGRIYRPVPQLVVRPGAFGPDDQGVHQRPDPAAAGPEGDAGGGVGLRHDGDVLADEEPQDAGSQDDEPTADQPADVRQVGALGDTGPE